MYRRSSGVGGHRRSSCLVVQKVNLAADAASGMVAGAGGIEESAARPSVVGGASKLPRASVVPGITGAGRPSISKKQSMRSVSTVGVRSVLASCAFTPQQQRSRQSATAAAQSARQPLSYTASKALGRLSSGSGGTGAGSESARRLSRRSSVGGGGGRRGGDLRPISDRDFQQACVTRVLMFVNSRDMLGSQRQLTAKELTKITSRLFDDIFLFVYAFLSPNVSLNSKKREEEVPSLLAALFYPGQLSKSHLKTIGTTSSWPHLIAMLDWLCQTVLIATGHNNYFKLLTQQINEDGFSSRAGSVEHARFLFTDQLYGRWVVSSDELDVQAEQRRFAEQLCCANTTEQLAQMRADNAQLLASLPPLAAAEQQLQEAANCRQLLEADMDRLTLHVKQLRQLEMNRTHELQQLNEENVQLVSRVQTAELRVTTLRERVDKQEMSSSDVERISRQKAAISTETARVTRECDELSERVAELEVSVSTVRASIDSKCRQLVDDVSVISATGGVGDNVNDLAVILRGPVSSMIQQLSCKQQTLEDFRRDLRHRSNLLHSQLLQAEKQLRQVAGSCEQRRLTHFQLESRLRRLTEQDDNCRQTAAQHQQHLTEQLEQVNAEIVQCQNEIRQLDLPALVAARDKLRSNNALQAAELQHKLEKREQEVKDMLTLGLEFKTRMEESFNQLARALAEQQLVSKQQVERKYQQFLHTMREHYGEQYVQQVLEETNDETCCVTSLNDTTMCDVTLASRDSIDQ